MDPTTLDGAAGAQLSCSWRPLTPAAGSISQSTAATPSTSSAYSMVLMSSWCRKLWLGPGVPLPRRVGYTGFDFPRPTRSANLLQYRGGIAIYVKNELAARGARKWRSCKTGEYGWLKIDNALGDKPLMLAACYFPPKQGANTKAQPRQLQRAWNALEMDMAEAQSIGHVVLAGDLNARTAQLSDTADDTITDSVEEELGLDAITLTASQLSIDSRNNTDPAVPNAAGKRFIQLCQATELVICNGRAAGDEVGATTSIGTRRNGKSVVDYFAVHMELFPEC